MELTESEGGGTHGTVSQRPWPGGGKSISPRPGEVYVFFDDADHVLAVPVPMLKLIEEMTMPDTAARLLCEMVEFFGKRPYQALGLRGRFQCVFCGATTLHESKPAHDPHRVWPRVLRLTNGVPVMGKVPRPTG